MYGSQALTRIRSRTTLERAAAARAASAPQDDYERWRRDVQIEAGIYG